MTPGSTPPCSSFIVPVTLPPDNCPNAVPVTRSKNNKHTIPFAKLIVSSLQISRYYGDDLGSLPAISYFLVLTDRLGQQLSLVTLDSAPSSTIPLVRQAVTSPILDGTERHYL